GGRLAGDKILPLDGSAQWLEAGSVGRQPSLTVVHYLFEGGAKALLARAPEIVLVLRRAVAVDVEEDEANEPRQQYGLSPVLHQASKRGQSRHQITRDGRDNAPRDGRRWRS